MGRCNMCLKEIKRGSSDVAYIGYTLYCYDCRERIKYLKNELGIIKLHDSGRIVGSLRDVNDEKI